MVEPMNWLLAAVFRALLLGVIWIALAGWEVSYAGYGVISVAAAVALSLILLPPGPLHPGQWPRRAWASVVLAGWFLWKSVAGGVDVSTRALKRTPDIAPAVVPAPYLLPDGNARQTATLLMNLMPGTMVQQVIDETGMTADHPRQNATGVELHTLSLSLDPGEQWEQLQRRVAAAYGVTV